MGQYIEELNTYSSNKFFEYKQFPFEERQFRVTQFMEDVLYSDQLEILPDRELFELLEVDEGTITEIGKDTYLINNIFNNLSRSGRYGTMFGDWIVERTGQRIIEKEKSSETKTVLIRGGRVLSIGLQLGWMFKDLFYNGNIPEGDILISTGMTVLFWQLIDVAREDPQLRKHILLSIYKELFDRSFLLQSERISWKYDNYRNICSILSPNNEITDQNVLELITVHGVINKCLNSFSDNFNQLNIGRHIHNNARHRLNFPSTLIPDHMREKREEEMYKVLLNLYFSISEDDYDDNVFGAKEYILGSREVRWRNFNNRL